jgi:hypothetical protein
LKYTPSDAPNAENLNETQLWVARELRAIAAQLNAPAQYSPVINATVPDKYTEGDLYYFRAGVVGLVAGYYYWNGTKWVFAGDYPIPAAAIYSNVNTNVSIPAANTYYKVANYNTVSAYQVEVVPDAANGTLQIGRDGLYTAQGFIDFINPQPNLTWTLAFFKNGVLAPLTETRVAAKDNNDGVNITTIITAPLLDGDIIDMRVQCSAAQGSVTLLTKLLSIYGNQ